MSQALKVPVPVLLLDDIINAPVTGLYDDIVPSNL
jgi:hypothetical protein